MGYFVCYGRKQDIGFNSPDNKFNDNYKNKFNELVIFANIDEVNKKMNNKQFDGEFGNDDFYIFNESTNNLPNSSTYTNFYSNIVSKKLQRINYDSVKDYITNNGPFNIANTQIFIHIGITIIRKIYVHVVIVLVLDVLIILVPSIIIGYIDFKLPQQVQHLSSFHFSKFILHQILQQWHIIVLAAKRDDVPVILSNSIEKC